MFGAIIGDIVGSPYEHTRHNIKTTDFPLFSEYSHFTDDTVMTVAVAIGLMLGGYNPQGVHEHVIDAMHLYGELYPRAGYGGRFRHWVRNRERESYGSYGNGAAMRVSAVGWMFHSLEEVEKFAKITACVSHDHPEGIKGAQSVAGSIYLARTGHSKEEIKAYVRDTYGYDLSRTLDEIRPDYVMQTSCQLSVPESIIAFLESTNFEDALRKAVSIGGDSDTIAAIAGSIAEAFYVDIPQYIQNMAISRLDIRILSVLRSWQTQFNRKN